MTAAVTSPAETMAVAFTRILRCAGVRTPIGNVLTFVEALDKVGIDDRDNVYWAGRAALLRRPEDIPLYDKAFKVFWERRTSPHVLEIDETMRITVLLDDEDEDGSSDEGDEQNESDETITVRFSAVETLRQKDFAEYSPEELQLAQDLMSKLRLAGPPRQSFRQRPRRRGSRPDLRRTVRASLRSGGEPVRRQWQDNDERLRRLVLLLDISGSMEPYARALLRFVHAGVAGRAKVEAFALGTRLTRVTRELTSKDPDR
ncbi:MAG: VWA domain-containing protein, partial [Actinomycetota bacterium]